MSRRANLPGAAELFRVTGARPAEPEVDEPDPGADEAPAPVPLRRPAAGAPAPRTRERTTGGEQRPEEEAGPRRRKPSGRERHDEKITVYISPEELHDLEHARLVLRREHGVRADRGRLVREALALVLSDLEAHGGDSELVRRLRER